MTICSYACYGAVLSPDPWSKNYAKHGGLSWPCSWMVMGPPCMPWATCPDRAGSHCSGSAALHGARRQAGAHGASVGWHWTRWGTPSQNTAPTLDGKGRARASAQHLDREAGLMMPHPGAADGSFGSR